jgi:hypothetical protein
MWQACYILWFLIQNMSELRESRGTKSISLLDTWNPKSVAPCIIYSVSVETDGNKTNIVFEIVHIRLCTDRDWGHIYYSSRNRLQFCSVWSIVSQDTVRLEKCYSVTRGAVKFIESGNTHVRIALAPEGYSMAFSTGGPRTYGHTQVVPKGYVSRIHCITFI